MNTSSDSSKMNWRRAEEAEAVGDCRVGERLRERPEESEEEELEGEADGGLAAVLLRAAVALDVEMAVRWRYNRSISAFFRP